MRCSRAFTRPYLSRIALSFASRRRYNVRCGHPIASFAPARVSEGPRRVRVVAATYVGVMYPVLPAHGACQRWVWNASYMDEDQAKDLGQRIQDQIRSLDRIHEEIAATCSSTQAAELDHLKSQQRQRANQLRHLLEQYKKVSGEAYPIDDSASESMIERK